VQIYILFLNIKAPTLKKMKKNNESYFFHS
jgi:hypothetical protein